MTSTKPGDVKKAMKKYLESGAVRTFIGWEKGSNIFRSRPGFFRKSDEVEGVIFSPACTPCLVRMIIEDIHYPLDEPNNGKPLGIILRGCDDKGIIELIKDQKIRREDVVIIGVDCPGTVSWRKIRDLLEKSEIGYDDLLRGELIWKDREVYISTDDGEKKLDREKVLMDKCLECEGHTPRIYDKLIGRKDTNRKVAPDPPEVISLDDKTPAEKWQFWEDVFSRCIKCFSCRSICTYCYCEECAVDPTTLAITDRSSAVDKANRPEWTGRDVTAPSNSVYLMMRAYHGSGRCISCEECDRACPMGLPLRMLHRKVRKDIRELFDYEAGNSIDDKPLLGDSCDSDSGDFIW